MFYDLNLTNSFSALAGFCQYGMYGKRIECHDPFLKKAIETGNLGIAKEDKDNDSLSVSPLKFYDTSVSFVALKGIVKISNYHEGKIVEAIKQFPKNKIKIEFEYEHVEIAKETEDRSLLIKGFAEIEPNKINISVESD